MMMRPRSTLLLLLPLLGWLPTAGVQAQSQASTPTIAAAPLLADEVLLTSASPLEPAAGPTLLDERAEQLRAAPESNEPAAAETSQRAMAPALLTTAAATHVKQALQEARRGKNPTLANVPAALQGYVKAAYLLSPKHKATAAQLNAWLADYPALAPAGDIYTLAEARRAKPREVCTTKTQQVKPAKASKQKTKKKPKARTKRVRTCRMVGEWGPQPPKTSAMLAREARREATSAAAEARRQAMAPRGRELSGQVWRHRSAGNWAAALETLLTPGARSAIGGAAWQEELVRLADFYHGKREWAQTYRAASQAAQAQGPRRDEALWLAGYAAYRQGDRTHAASFWQTLIAEEPKGGQHYGRAAWWAARVLTDLGRTREAEQMLTAGAGNPLSFYGQLAAMRLGREAKLDFAGPGVPTAGREALLANPQARLGLMLAQVGEVAWAEAELRSATPSLPLQANQALAGMAVALDLPSTALRAGRDLLDDGVRLPAALFPLPTWRPTGGWQFDRAFMLGLMRQESAFQPTIGSRVGAQGLMQIMPATGQYIARMTGRSYGGKRDLHHPATNLAMAQDYLAYLTRKLDGNLLMVAAAYNGGIGNVQRWLARGVTPDADPLLWLESIPFDETRDYVEKIMFNYWVYQQRLNVPRTSLREMAQNRWPRW